MERLIKKCIVPAAGLGTRFLPATKAVPKEMLPIVDTPTIQLIVEEAVASGVEDVVLINGRGKASIEDHFDIAVEHEKILMERGKTKDRDAIRAIANLARVISIRQKEPLGLGHAVLCGAPITGNESFGVALGDDLIDAETPGLLQLARAHRKHNDLGVIALMEVHPSQTHLYGIAAGKKLDDRTIKIEKIVEKPKQGTAPSNLAVIGRYVLPPKTMDILKSTKPGVGGEIQLTDALAELAAGPGLLGCLFEGKRYDAGDKVGYIEANVAYALKRPEMKDSLLAFMAEVVKKGGI
ncbi:MAG: UTP--glucose-1-phosphate uridylyltransferase GalU [Deltaproteobacteria bacterium]|nr:UTP--glucose-1-phosphate uridylyltransferase GalU [Deltaproteobacteria bacterium]